MANKAKATKKKRNKRYTGEDAAIRGTKVTKVVATHKSPLREFWDGRKIQILGLSAMVIVVGGIGYLGFVLVSWVL